MRKICVLVIIALAVLSCLVTSEISTPEMMEVYYVPRTMSTEGKLFESETRDLKLPYVSFYCTSSTDKIKEFAKLAFSPTEPPETVIKDVPPYMVVDIIYSNREVKTVVFGPSIFYKQEDRIYPMSLQLKDWIDRVIPKATFPTGSRNNGCE